MTQQINPAPVPTIWGLDHTPDGQYIVLIANTHQGQAVHFLAGETGQGFIDALTDQVAKCAILRAEVATQHIEVPAQVMFGPDGKPIRIVPPVVETASEAKSEAAGEAVASPEEKLLHAIFDGEPPVPNEPEPNLKLIDGSGGGSE